MKRLLPFAIALMALAMALTLVLSGVLFSVNPDAPQDTALAPRSTSLPEDEGEEDDDDDDTPDADGLAPPPESDLDETPQEGIYANDRPVVTTFNTPVPEDSGTIASQRHVSASVGSSANASLLRIIDPAIDSSMQDHEADAVASAMQMQPTALIVAAAELGSDAPSLQQLPDTPRGPLLALAPTPAPSVILDDELEAPTPTDNDGTDSDGIDTPTPTDGIDTPTPTDGIDTPTPTDGIDTPTPTDGIDTPTPTDGIDTPTPTDGIDTPTPTDGIDTPTPTDGIDTPTPTDNDDSDDDDSDENDSDDDNS